jgi:hypothetical protein
MTPFPVVWPDLVGHWESYIVYVVIGAAFGAVLEMAGFGNSKKLAAQFYFSDMTVLKVMFTGIVTAMLLIFATSALGLLDYNLIWVNPTYLWPGILGGLIMGVGFIIGGFCPGTSMVAAATLKIDGIFFLLGAFFGIFLFGETVGSFTGFWNSSDMGRYTLAELFGVDAGLVALGVVLMALGAFAFAEWAEKTFGQKTAAFPRWQYGAAGGGVLLAALLVIMGQPSNADRWASIQEEQEARLAAREVQIHPAELLHLLYNDRLEVVMIDLRSESDFNQFHILDAENIPYGALPDHIEAWIKSPANTVFVLMSNDETAATAAWKWLLAESLPNTYILEGGVNNWLSTFAEAGSLNPALVPPGPDQLAYTFSAAIGSRHPAANPNLDMFEGLVYTEKVKLQSKRAGSGGGCG